jgi:hypothetical protein
MRPKKSEKMPVKVVCVRVLPPSDNPNTMLLVVIVIV